MIRVRVYEKEKLSEGVQICIDSYLYIPGWSLRRSLSNADSSKDRLSICFNDDEAVALAFITDFAYWGNYPKEPTLMSFCKESERRKGYGTRCVNALGDRPSGIVSYTGVHGSAMFWRKNGLISR